MLSKFAQGIMAGLVVAIVVVGGLILTDVLVLGTDAATADDHDHSYLANNTSGGTTHQHTTMIDLTDTENIPTVDIQVSKDPKAGFNVKINTTNFTFSPEHASTEHIVGEGHAHLYVNGVKIGRVYSEWVHVEIAEPGIHEIKVTLNGNDHSPFMVDGVEIADIANVAVE